MGMKVWIARDMDSNVWMYKLKPIKTYFLFVPSGGTTGQLRLGIRIKGVKLKRGECKQVEIPYFIEVKE